MRGPASFSAFIEAALFCKKARKKLYAALDTPDMENGGRTRGYLIVQTKQ